MQNRGEEADELGAGVFGGGVGDRDGDEYRDHAGDDDGHRIANKRAVIGLLKRGEDEDPDKDIGELAENGGEKDQIGGVFGDGFVPAIGVAAAEAFGEAAVG